MNCAECRERLYPENPTVGAVHKGRYYAPICHSCPNYAGYPEEVDDPNILHEAKDVRYERKAGVDLHKEIAQLKGQVMFLMAKQQESRPYSKKRRESF